MTITLNDTAVNPTLLITVAWGGGAVCNYADKTYAAPVLGSFKGNILQANMISKTGQLDESGDSIACSVTLDDTDGALKTIYDTLRMEGSACEVYESISRPVSPYTTVHLIFKGVVSSDIVWNEGERTLSFSIEGGNARNGSSGEIGYAPELGAFTGLNPSAIGENWPIVFGSAIKVPAVRISYYDDMVLDEVVQFDTVSFHIQNGEQLPQLDDFPSTTIRITVDGLILEGTMDEDVFTVLDANLPKYTVAEIPTFAARDSGDADYLNAAVAWVAPGLSFQRGSFIYIESQDGYIAYVNQVIGHDTVTGKVIFEQAWPYYVTEDFDFGENARYCRSTWPVTFHVTFNSTDTLYTAGQDTWYLPKGATVNYDAGTDYMDRYVCNLYPSTSVMAVWGKRTVNGHERWEKIPSDHYHVHLNEAIVTAPGAVTRHCTFIDFPQQLSSYLCEDWKEDIWVSLVSTLPATPLDICDFICDNFTTFSFNPLGASTVTTVNTNFAYFETTDAITFLREYARQIACVIQISGTTLNIRAITTKPVTGAGVHTLTDDLIIMKSLVLGFKAKEEINTVHKSIYVTDYSGEKSSSHIYQINQNVSTLGFQIVEEKLWALTCYNAVKAVTDFWGVKKGNSWKTVKMDCFLELTDANVFDGCVLNISPFLVDGAVGILTSVVHNLDRPCVSIEIEMAVKTGTNVNDATYWAYVPSACTIDAETPGTAVDPDPTCAAISYDIGAKIPGPQYQLVITKIYWKSSTAGMTRIFYELHGKGVWDPVKHTKVYDIVAINDVFQANIYSISPHTPLFVTAGTITAGVGSLLVPQKCWKFPATWKSRSIHMSATQFGDNRIKTGLVACAKNGHL